MDALASAACFNTVRRVILDLAIVLLPVTCLIGDGTIYTITDAPHSGAPSRFLDCRHLAEGAEPQVVASAAVTRDPSKREPGSPVAGKKNPAAAVRPRAGNRHGGLC
jgi:hypothetical protein